MKNAKTKFKNQLQTGPQSGGSVSSWVETASYDPDNKVLELTTVANRYRYYDVPKSIWVKLSTTDSIGTLFNNKIKGKFRKRKLKLKV